MPDKLSAPIFKGDKLGEIEVLKDGEKIQSISLIAQEDVAKATFLNNIYKAIRYWIDN